MQIQGSRKSSRIVCIPISLFRRFIMFCQNCGQQITDNAPFCQNCGAPTGAAQNQQNSVPNQQYYAPNQQYYGPNQPYYGAPQPNPMDAPSTGYALLGFLIPIVGLILYLVWKDTMPQRARSVGRGALIGFIVGVVVGIVFGILSATVWSRSIASYLYW